MSFPRHCGLAFAAAFTLASPVAAQTWTRAVNTNWNTAGNWNGGVIPNSSIAAAVFGNPPVPGSVNISTSVTLQSLAFTNATGAYIITSSAGQTMSGLTDITIGDA